MCKGFIDEKTRKKINIEGGKYQKVLLENVDAANLPEFLGGTCKCESGCLNTPAGPWAEQE